MKTFQIKLILVFFIFANFSLKLYGFGEHYINVHLVDVAKLSITTASRGYEIQHGNKKNLLNINKLNVSVIAGNIQINNTRYNDRVVISSRSPIRINEIDYDGDIQLIVNDKNRIRVINRIGFENYLTSVINAEMGGQAPLEALKAQAVAARTITLTKITSQKHLKDGYDLCSSTHCQVYKGLTGITPSVMTAVKQTNRMVLVYNGNPIEAFYSAHCGGITECSENVWQTRRGYLLSQPDGYCINASLIPNWNKRSINWEASYTKKEIEKLLDIKGIKEIVISKRYDSSRVEEITVNASKKITINGQYEIRNRLNLPSTLFTITKVNDHYLFIGNGYGHGVGMCQTGAIARANAGMSYKDILDFYYANTSIVEN